MDDMDFQLTRENPEDIGIATTSLILGIITLQEFKEWAYFVIEHSMGDVPNYIYDIIELSDKYDYTLHVDKYVGFWPAWDATDLQLSALQGLGFIRFSNFFSDAIGKEDALKAFKECPEVIATFKKFFQLIALFTK
jgi:hypothetical protein